MYRSESSESPTPKKIKNQKYFILGERKDLDRYIPDDDYQKEQKREWFVNLVNTLLEVEFKDFIRVKLKARETKVIKNRILENNSKRLVHKNLHEFKISPNFFEQNTLSSNETKIKIRRIQRVWRWRDSLTKRKIYMSFLPRFRIMKKWRKSPETIKKYLAKLYDLGIVNSDGEYVE